MAHVLPTSYTCIRHFGFLANRKVNIDCIKKFLGDSGKTDEGLAQSTQELMLELTGKDILKCPKCSIGTMAVHHLIPRLSVWINSQFSEP